MPAQARESWGCGTRLCMFNMSFRLPTQLWMRIGCLPACLAAVYNPVACLLSVQLGGPSPKVLTASLCIQILGMGHCHSTICSISFFFSFLFSCHLLLFFFVCSFFVGRTQPQHINFRTDIGQPFLQPVDAVRSVRHYQHGRVHFLLALL